MVSVSPTPVPGTKYVLAAEEHTPFGHNAPPVKNASDTARTLLSEVALATGRILV
jgi:hypothetical protein